MVVFMVMAMNNYYIYIYFYYYKGQERTSTPLIATSFGAQHWK